MSRDTVGDFITIIRNAVRIGKPMAFVPHSKMRENIAQILKNEGFIRDFALVDENNKKLLKLYFKYVHGESVIHEITRISTPGCRRYSGSVRLKPVINGLGISILSTSRGVITDKHARQAHVGGEVLCTVW